MTIGDYMANPYGKGASFANTTLQREDLEKDYPALKDYIKTNLYKAGKDLIFHVQIPSRKSNRVLYDVIIEIEAGAADLRPINYLDSEFLVFSNCPSFVYSYANLYYHKGYLCKWLLQKYPASVRRHAAEERNPYAVIGYERSLYLALYHLRKSGLFVSRNAIARALVKNRRNIAILVKTFDDVEKDYNVFTKLDKEKEAKRQANIKKGLPPPRKDPNAVNAFHKASKAERVRQVKTVPHGKKTQRMKGTQKI